MAKVLVVDDDDIIRDLLCRVLRVLGHQTFAFSDGAPVLAINDFSSIDLIITDLDMPTRGDRIIQNLRKRGCDVPIIVMSGWLQQKDFDYLTSIGAQVVLQKPFRMTDLQKYVEMWVQKERQR